MESVRLWAIALPSYSNLMLKYATTVADGEGCLHNPTKNMQLLLVYRCFLNVSHVPAAGGQN